MSFIGLTSEPKEQGEKGSLPRS